MLKILSLLPILFENLSSQMKSGAIIFIEGKVTTSTQFFIKFAKKFFRNSNYDFELRSIINHDQMWSYGLENMFISQIF